MNLGAPEILVILVVALLVFGPHRLPEIGRQVGGAMRELRKMQDSVKSELHSVMQDDAPSYDAQTIKPVSATPGEVAASALDRRSARSTSRITSDTDPPRDGSRCTACEARTRLRRPFGILPVAGLRSRGGQGPYCRRPDDADRTPRRTPPPRLHLRDRGRRRRGRHVHPVPGGPALPRGPVPRGDRGSQRLRQGRLRPHRDRSARTVPRAAEDRGLRRAGARAAGRDVGDLALHRARAATRTSATTRSRSSSRSSCCSSPVASWPGSR